MKKLIFTVAIVALLVSLNACNKTLKTETTTTTVDTIAVSKMATEVSPSGTEGTFCFLKAENKDSTKVTLTIAGNDVKGKMVWNPYQKDGARGTLTGTKNASGEFELMYNYMIEGNNQSETKVMKIENGELLIKEGLLEDLKNDGNLRFKDVSKAVYSEKLSKVVCK